jgi:hypothetical protein
MLWDLWYRLPSRRGKCDLSLVSRSESNVPCRENSSANFPYVSKYLSSAKIAHDNSKLIPGHEIVGTISALGGSVEGFAIGDRCVVDPTVLVSPRWTIMLKSEAYVQVVRDLFLLSAWPVVTLRKLQQPGRNSSRRFCRICGGVSSL